MQQSFAKSCLSEWDPESRTKQQADLNDFTLNTPVMFGFFMCKMEHMFYIIFTRWNVVFTFAYSFWKKNSVKIIFKRDIVFKIPVLFLN